MPDYFDIEEAMQHDHLSLAQEANRQLLSENEALRKDAERYRWVREHSCQYDSNGWEAESWSTHSNPTSLDKAIDESMKGANMIPEDQDRIAAEQDAAPCDEPIDVISPQAIAEMFSKCYASSYLRGDEVAGIIRGRYCKDD